MNFLPLLGMLGYIILLEIILACLMMNTCDFLFLRI
jgi:hypothetical protein